MIQQIQLVLSPPNDVRIPQSWSYRLYGWLMSQMDMGGAILAKELAHGRVVTVRVEGMTFLRPVAVGDVVCCYARCVKRGRTSISINVEVWVKKVSSEPIGQRYRATEALFIYVAVDESGKPRPLPMDAA